MVKIYHVGIPDDDYLLYIKITPNITQMKPLISKTFFSIMLEDGSIVDFFIAL